VPILFDIYIEVLYKLCRAT